MSRAVVFVNGELIGDKSFYQNYIKPDDTIVCADGGAEHALSLQIQPDLILGDLDSIFSKTLKYYESNGVKFEKFPSNKDKTDTQLLLERLIVKEYDEIIIFAALGDRVDHSLGNIYLLEGLYTSRTNIKLVSPNETLQLIKNKTVISNQQGKTISLLPLTKQITGVSLSGFKYELDDGILKRGETLGLSNVIKQNLAVIDLKQGSLLLVINN